jgi:hypothetical protein
VAIAPCFDPTTGASGGATPGGGGSSLYDVAMTGPVDLTDGSWILTDPDSLIDTVTFDGTHNTVTWNALAVGSNNYVWDTSSAKRGPRWHKALTIDGNAVTTDDIIQAVIRVANDDSLRELPNKLVAGPCVDPTSTNENTIAGMGALASALIAGSVTDYGVWTVASSASTNSGAGVAGLATSQYGGRHTGSAVFTILNSSNLRVQNGARNGAVVLGGGAALNWMVGVGARGGANTWAAGVKQTFRVDLLALKLSLP